MKINFDLPKFLNGIDASIFFVLYGGRGAGKTFALCSYLILSSFRDKDCYYLCAREIQESLQASLYSVLEKLIKDMDLQDAFELSKTGIKNTQTGVKIIFRGLWRDPDSIKGIPSIKKVLIDEASAISRRSWNILVPTISRNQGCQMLISFNPEFEDDVVYDEFVKNNTRQDTIVRKISHEDNEYLLPASFFKEMFALKNRDYDLYLHVYEGHCKVDSEQKVFKKDKHWCVQDFEESNNIDVMIGLDLGFSATHPTFAVRMYIENNCIYVTHEAVKTGLDICDLNDFLVEELPNVQQVTVWTDSSRPETISAMKRRNTPTLWAKGVKKGTGSVEDGIEHLRSFDMIYIHSSCEHLIENFKKYGYKTDRADNVLREVEKKYDDGIDAMRYALESTMLNKMVDYRKVKHF
jgi:phage terminase large subunit